jgi:hypothetical protein
MKRHLTTLLQRKRAEFEGPSDAHRPGPDTPEVVVVQVKDGYDWLPLIKQVQPQHASAL